MIGSDDSAAVVADPARKDLRRMILWTTISEFAAQMRPVFAAGFPPDASLRTPETSAARRCRGRSGNPPDTPAEFALAPRGYRRSHPATVIRLVSDPSLCRTVGVPL